MPGALMRRTGRWDLRGSQVPNSPRGIAARAFRLAHCGGVLRIASAADPARPLLGAGGAARLVRRDLGLA
jgi:hypothetical protein